MAFDLKRDSYALLRFQWLEADEKLIAWTPVWKMPRLSGIPRPPMPLSYVLARIGGFLWRAPLFLILAALALYALGEAGGGGDLGGGGGGSKKYRKGPPVLIRGEGANSEAGRLVTHALRSRGIWVLTDRRLAFVTVRGRTCSRLTSAEATPEDRRRRPESPVPVDDRVEVRADRFQRVLAREVRLRTRLLRRTVTVGVYDSAVFPDGSGVAFRRTR